MPDSICPICKLHRQDYPSPLPEIEPALTFGEKVSDKMAEFGGSWKFLGIFTAILVFWILLNTLAFMSRPFDPFPYILLNLVLSCIAAVQAPVIMMSQNRQAKTDRHRAENDYMINLKSELEIRQLHTKLDMLIVQFNEANTQKKGSISAPPS